MLQVGTNRARDGDCRWLGDDNIPEKDHIYHSSVVGTLTHPQPVAPPAYTKSDGGTRKSECFRAKSVTVISSNVSTS